ncbi:MAG: amino acid adenylation domain-containing protein [Planctomycetes bacterium]|nr:amino acid adenylation domain-containing protein [Planctomycetota bacterium]
MNADPTATEAAARPSCLHELLTAAVRAHPQRIALDIPPGPQRPARVEWTYAELEAQAARVRGAVEQHVTGECVVAVLLARHDPALFAAQIGVLRCGAAFVCPDPLFPDSHLRFVLADSGAVAVVTDEAGAARLAGIGIPLLDVAALPSAPVVSPRPPWLTPRSLAYVIYTSGTSGQPKGVLLEHSGIVDLISQDLGYFGLAPGDRIAQGSSHAFDSSLEEVWCAFASGATCVVMDDEVVRSGPDLIEFLRRERVTVLMPTPTLLRATGCVAPHAALPDLRLVYAGGEAIAPELVARWGQGIWLENGYGPTECTVTATRTRLHPGVPVTIGVPIPGRNALVLDPELHPVADGVPGELCLSGVGLARGYLGLPELTAERFPVHPHLGRLYRTGDSVVRQVDGTLLYQGRLDAQVKVRGHRIELEAIEAALAAVPGVRAAGCVLVGSVGREQLVGCVVSNGVAPAESFDPEATRTRLRAELPEPMVPARLVLVAALPTTVGGKLDRRALAAELERAAAARSAVAPASPGAPLADPIERRIAAAMASALELPQVGRDEDFFSLGGTSLRAAELISALRTTPDTARLAVREVYELRTVERLAARARHGGAAEGALPDPEDSPGSVPGARPVLCTVAQGLWLLFGLSWVAPLGYLLAFDVLPWSVEQLGAVGALLLLPFLGPLLMPLRAVASVALAVATKRLLIGRYRPGSHPAWGWFYLRHWIVLRTVRLVPWRRLAGTPWQASVLRALGARVGRRVHIHRGVELLSGGWDLLEIGDDVTLGQEVRVGLVHLAAGRVHCAPVRIEDRATLGVRSGVGGDTVVGAGAQLTPLSSLCDGGRIPQGARWDGVPAQPRDAVPAAPVVDHERELGEHAFGLRLMAAQTGVSVLLALPFFGFVSAAVWLAELGDPELLAWWSDPGIDWRFVAALLGLSVLGLLASLVMRALLLWAIPAVPDGSIGRFDPRYVGVWLRTDLVTGAGTWLSGSLLWPVWLRGAGMRIGRGCEISTIVDVLPENVTVGAECFFADGIYLAGPWIDRGTVTTAHTEIGTGTFFGNHVVVPPGAVLPDDLLLGICTPAEPRSLRSASSWFGHPPFELPHREVVELDRALTHRPSPLRWLHRLAWELLRFALPAVGSGVLVGWLAVVGALHDVPRGLSWWAGVVGSGALTVAAPCVLVLALKWLLLGRVQPGRHGLWSSWCCRWDFLYVAWGFLARGLLDRLAGTLWLTFYLRAMGMRIGRRVLLGGGFAQVVDPDMLEFADGATFEGLFQAHSFEDRVLKIGRVRLGEGSTVRGGAVLLYGAEIGQGSTVAPHSVVMKHEVLQPHRHYAGCPVR